MNYKERLKKYLEVDTLYQNYKKGIEEEKSDFDLFCVQHCLDIENLLNEVEELHNKIDKANATIDTNLELIEHLGNKIDKAIEYINSQSPDAGVSGKRIKEILKDSDVDEYGRI